MWPGTLRGPRVTLRAPRPEDAHDVHAYASDPDVTRYLSWPTHKALEDSQAWIRQAEASWRAGSDFPLVLEVDGRVVGGTGFTPMGSTPGSECGRPSRSSCGASEPPPRGEGGLAGPPTQAGQTARVGYVLRRPSWGQGLASEALALLCQWLLAEARVGQVEALVHPDNVASIHVLRKAGFVATILSPRCGALPNLGGTPDVWTYVLHADVASAVPAATPGARLP